MTRQRRSGPAALESLAYGSLVRWARSNLNLLTRLNLLRAGIGVPGDADNRPQAAGGVACLNMPGGRTKRAFAIPWDICVTLTDAHALSMADIPPQAFALWERLVGLSQPVCLNPGYNKL